MISTLANSLIGRYDIIIIPFVENIPFYKLHCHVKIIPCKKQIATPDNIFASLKLNFQLVRKTSEILQREGVHVTIGFITSANIIAVIASKIARIPCIISERNNPMKENVTKFWVLLRRFLYPRANYVVLQTNGIKEFYNKQIKASKMVILPNPISKELTEKRENRSKREKTILTVGRLDINKCHELIIRAFHQISNEDWKVLIVGDGDNKSYLENLIDDLGLQEKVNLIGATKDIAQYYNTAQIFAFASRTEGFPNALLEAMHFGLPSLSTDCAFGPADLIQDQVNGYLVPVDDLEKFKGRLKKLMESKALRKKIGENAKVSTNNFKTEMVVEKWADLIERTL